MKHYTGELNILKGWCPKIRFADKILQSDFLHTAQGAPIYFETTITLGICAVTTSNSSHGRGRRTRTYAKSWCKPPTRQGRIVQVSILTTDLTRALDEIVKLRFRRWLQENDFKYLNQHFGINQITRYRSVDYEKLNRVKRRERIAQGHAVLEKVRTEIATAAPTESRLEVMIEAATVKLEPQSKRLMDLLRITVRNGFYQALQPFKKAYDNYRDDHVYFRQLTQSPGVLEVSADEILIHLFPRTH